MDKISLQTAIEWGVPAFAAVFLIVMSWKDASRISRLRSAALLRAAQPPRERLELIDGAGRPLGIFREIPRASEPGRAA